MIWSSFLLFTLSTSIIGLALSDDSGFDWDTDDDYESPFADEDEESFSEDDYSKELEEAENPFASVSDDDDDDDKPESEPSPSADESKASSEDDESPLDTLADARAFCDEAMGLLHDGDADRAFDRLSIHWAFSQEEMTQLQGEVERTRAVVADRYGDALDYRLLREDTAGDVLACFVYLERFDLHGLRWRFTFYEGGSGWTLNDVFFDDEIEALLE